MVDEPGFKRLYRLPPIPIRERGDGGEGKGSGARVLEAYELGLGDPVGISAEHGEGLVDLFEALREALPEKTRKPEAVEQIAESVRPIRVAIVGRPNSGKSTLVNRLLGEDRMLTGPEAGLTRDTIAADLTWRGRGFRLHDTAGLRRPPRVQEKLEKLSVADAIHAIRFAEVVVLLMDAEHPFEEQDLRIADLVEREGRALVIAISKWDLKEGRSGGVTRMQEEADERLPQVKGLPVIGVSGLTGDGIDRLMQALVDIYEVWNRRVGTAELNRWLEEAIGAHPPPAVSGRRIKLNYMTQSKARPPSFVLFCARADKVPPAYQRYLVNAIREHFDLPGTPVRLTLREKDNPFEGRRKRKH